VSSPFESSSGHWSIGALPSAMFTASSSSSIATRPSPLQSPAQVGSDVSATATEVGFSPTLILVSTASVTVSTTATSPRAAVPNGWRSAT
jgi:hypothetical protein